MSRTLPIILAIPLAVLACGTETSVDDGLEGIPTLHEDTDDGGLKLDIAGGEGGNTAGNTAGDGGGNQACLLVDVILAVDNSDSMAEEIMALRGPVFDSLPEQLLDVGNGIEDFHLAVIDACPKPAHFHDTGLSGACNFSSAANYMSSTSGVLDDEFSCVTEFVATGWMGVSDMCLDSGEFADDDEQPALTAATALSPVAEMANAGFLRDDSILFVVAITDEDEEMLGTDADTIAQTLIDAKAGNIENVVFLGIGGGADCDGEYGSALAATNLAQTTALFEAAGRGLFWDLCDGDLEAAFAAGIAIVDSACDEFDPPK